MKKIIALVFIALLLTACIEVNINTGEEPKDTNENEKVTVDVETPEEEVVEYPPVEGWEKEEGMAIPSFIGSAEVEGWLEYVESYGDEKVPHFRLSPESLKKLPGEFSEREYTRYFKLSSHEDLVTQLKGTSENNRKKAIITNITIPMEGTPYFESLEILN